MSVFFIRLWNRPEPYNSRFDRSNVEASEQEGERVRRQSVEHVWEVKANYWLERRVFF
jgi:hypothetical protein